MFVSALRRASAVLFSVVATAAFAAPETVTLMLKPRPQASETALAALYAAHGAREFDRIPALNIRLLRVPAAVAEQIRQALAARAEVDYVEADAVAQAVATPDDPYFTQQWHLAKIQAPAAWDFTTGSAGVVIAVVDTGANASNPDLAGRLLAGYDFVNSDSDPQDDNGHGTAVSGVAAAATNNALGVAGVAWNCPVLPVKVLGADGSGAYSNIVRGITFAADSGARIINLSLGGTTNSRSLQDAVNYAWGKSAVVIAAAGNNGNSIAFYPGACANVVAVSATDANDIRPSWSNYGSYVDLSAPGAGVVTLALNNGYASWNGTSFSSPVVSGVAALVASAAPSAGNAQIVDLLLKNSDDIGAPGYDVYYGFGRVNAARALSAARAAFAPDATAPSAYLSSPAVGATVSGVVTVSGDATDNVGVTRLELRVDGVLVASANAASISYAWDTRLGADGARVLELRAYDAAGNTGSATRSVNVSNAAVADTTAPSAVITSPANGSRLSGKTVSISVRATDNVGVAKIDLYIDGRLFGTSATASATFNWNTSKAAAGAHTLQAMATDAAGNTGASAVVTVYK